MSECSCQYCVWERMPLPSGPRATPAEMARMTEAVVEAARALRRAQRKSGAK